MVGAKPKSRVSFLLLEDKYSSLTPLAESLRKMNENANIMVTQKSTEAMYRIRNAVPTAFIVDLDAVNFETTNIFEIIHSNEDLNKLPIIALTTLDRNDESLQMPCMEAINYLQKPASVNDILTFTKGILTGKTQGTAKFIKLNAGDSLFKQGEAGRSFYLVQEGLLKVMIEAGGDLLEVGEITEKQVVGEMAFIDGSARSAHVIAARDTILIEVPAKNLEEAVSKSAPIAVALIKTLVGRVRSLNDQLAEFRKKAA